MKIITTILLLVVFVGTAFSAEQNKKAVGFNIDLLPTVLSASAGTLGGAGQVWYASNHLRFRAVGAHFRLPNSLIGKDHFQKQETTALALICDYLTGKELQGFWLGSGVELWLNRIGHENTTETATWNNAVFTVGGGYIWKFWRNFFVDPWAAGHLILNSKEIHLARDTFKPQAFTAEVSVKLGWYFDVK